MTIKKCKLGSKVFASCTFLALACGCINSPNSRNETQIEKSETTSIRQFESDGQTDNSTTNKGSERYGAIERKGNWNYQDQTDPMTDKIIHIADCVSNETQSICGFRTLLHLGISNVDGYNFVMLSIQDGILREDKLPMAHVRFDNEDVEMWSVIRDGTTTHHIVNSTKFINRLKKSKKCAIKVEAQDGGTGTYTFNTEGLNWNY